MKHNENLQYIKEVRKVAYDVFTSFDEEEKRKKRLRFWKNMIKFFVLSLKALQRNSFLFTITRT